MIEKKKRRWKKIIISLVIGFVVFLIALVIAFFVCMDWLLASGIREIAPKFTGTAVQLEKVKLSPVNGSLALRGFAIGNPEGYATAAAFRFDLFMVEADLGTVTSDKIVINEIRIVNPAITWERGLTGSNLGDIQNNIEKMTAKSKDASSAPAADEADAEAEKSAGKQVVIKRLVIEGARLYIGIKGTGAAVPIPLPTITLTDIGENRTTTVGEAVEFVYGKILLAVVDAAANAGGDAAAMAADLGGKLIEDTTQNLREIGGTAIDVLGRSGGDAVEVVTDAGGKLVEDIGSSIGNALK